MSRKTDIPALSDALRSGDRRALARAITLVESGRTDHRAEALALIEALGPIGGQASVAVARLRHATTARRIADASQSRLSRTLPSLEAAIDARLGASHMTREAAGLIVERNLRTVNGGVAWRSDPRARSSLASGHRKAINESRLCIPRSTTR